MVGMNTLNKKHTQRQQLTLTKALCYFTSSIYSPPQIFIVRFFSIGPYSRRMELARILQGSRGFLSIDVLIWLMLLERWVPALCVTRMGKGLSPRGIRGMGGKKAHKVRGGGRVNYAVILRGKCILICILMALLLSLFPLLYVSWQYRHYTIVPILLVVRWGYLLYTYG